MWRWPAGSLGIIIIIRKPERLAAAVATVIAEENGGDWKEYLDPKSGLPYTSNTATMETTWEAPPSYTKSTLTSVVGDAVYHMSDNAFAESGTALIKKAKRKKSKKSKKKKRQQLPWKLQPLSVWPTTWQNGGAWPGAKELRGLRQGRGALPFEPREST